jgi:hypothetical protein
MAPRALLLIGARDDNVCPIEGYEKLYERAGEPKNSTPVELPDELAEVIKRFGIEAPDTPAIANDHPRAAPPM